MYNKITQGKVEFMDTTVLVVDDESRMRKLIKDFLMQKNYKIIESKDGEEAL